MDTFPISGKIIFLFGWTNLEELQIQSNLNLFYILISSKKLEQSDKNKKGCDSYKNSSKMWNNDLP